ncbi:ABC transporter substrate-binding protein [Histidinibacterium lentulum]|uniref:ABC transporter substrate-binding protein n=2 Tax=Histidinibacterium lentulum TaxID=2480588 RepID=A0A3N2R0M0_9RHOB|nr:ABC transporter substrate-binding protein [Histidinibacterium lentulum]
MTVTRPTRRALLCGAAAVTAAGLLPAPAMAVDRDQAAALVNRLVGEINAVIARGGSEEQMYQAFAGIFDRYADVPRIAVTALGRTPTRPTQDQLQRYVSAFRVYIAWKYGSRFREFIGGQIVVEDVGRPYGDFVDVRSIAYLRGEDPFRVDFKISDRSGRLLFEDMVIEGINMLDQESTEIRAMLARRGGDIEGLIADLR